MYINDVYNTNLHAFPSKLSSDIQSSLYMFRHSLFPVPPSRFLRYPMDNAVVLAIVLKFYVKKTK